MDRIESHIMKVYHMRHRTNWEKPDAVYNAWWIRVILC